MRTIKFRGKAEASQVKLDEMGILHKDGYVYGNLIVDGAIAFIVGGIVEWGSEYLAHEWWVKVDINTVGQCTEYKDKNGIEIYEKDTVKTYNGDLGVVKYGEYQDSEILRKDKGHYIDANHDKRKEVGFYIDHEDGDYAGLDSRADKWITVIKVGE